jgi:ergothioneine biosynthesis protein EgtB
MIESSPQINPLASLKTRYQLVRKESENICKPLNPEDYVAQPIVDVSPPKWHLAHTTWFFETFVLLPHMEGYAAFHPKYAFLFNSYYQNLGERVNRQERGALTRPTVKEVYAYRAHVDEAMDKLLCNWQYHHSLTETIELGLQHEQQHQELLWTDIKYILSLNPLKPAYREHFSFEVNEVHPGTSTWKEIEGGVHQIGFAGKGFCFDNELKRHNVYLEDFAIQDQLITNSDFLEFMEDGGYSNFNLWHYEAWWWKEEHRLAHPLYWENRDGEWWNFTFSGMQKVNPNEYLKHISFYEAYAFAQWKGLRLPTEFEWEVAAQNLHYGSRWEWTESAYLPYPGYTKAAGAIGEYNGKFMVNQKVLRGDRLPLPKIILESVIVTFGTPT